MTTVNGLLFAAANAETVGEESALLRQARALAASRGHAVILSDDGEGYEEGTFSDLQEEEHHP